jgi:hypothetical protein
MNTGYINNWPFHKGQGARMIHRKTILKEFVVLLILSSIVISSIVGTANILLMSNPKNGNTNESMTSYDLIRQKGTQNREVLFFEGFEGDFPPAGWTQIITNTGYCDDYPQYAAHWDQFSYNIHNGTKAAYVWWDYQPQDEWLITSEINLVDVPNGELTFWSYGYEGSTYNDHYYVKISTDNGSTWEVLFDLSSFPPNQGWNFYASPYIIDLTAYEGQIIRLAWQVFSLQNDGIWYQWCVDDIEVTGGDNTPPVTTCTITGIYDAIITFTATDDMSGVEYTKYKLDNGVWTEYVVPIVVSKIGNHTVYYYSVDKAGNIEEEKNKAFTIQSPITITIKGGLGVSATIKNSGTIDLTDINWSIALDGKLIVVGKTKSGTIDVLTAGEEIIVKDSVIGFGKTHIGVSVGTEDATASGTVFLIFVIGVI